MVKVITHREKGNKIEDGINVITVIKPEINNNI